jgi:hypothetical protein
MNLIIKEKVVLFQENRARQEFNIWALAKIRKTVLGFLSFVSKSEFISKKIKFQPGKYGFFLAGDYWVTHNYGLMSIASTTLSELSFSAHPVKRIRSNLGMSLQKKNLLSNNWDSFFQTSSTTPPPGGARAENPCMEPIHRWWRCDYDKLPLHYVRNNLRNYFLLSNPVKQFADYFSRLYRLNLGETVGVHFRGTDKVTEIATPSLEDFILKTANALRDIKNPKVLLLTDEPDAIKAFSSAFPNILITIEELKTPPKQLGVKLGSHMLGSKSAESQAQIFLAILYLVSQCRRVVTHTGNGALWEVLFRGSTQGLEQLRG